MIVFDGGMMLDMSVEEYIEFKERIDPNKTRVLVKGRSEK